MEKQNTLSKRHSRVVPNEVTLLKAELLTEKRARLAAERRCAELEAKVKELTKRLDKLLQGQSETHEMLQKSIRKLEKDVADRDEKIQEQGKTIAWFRKKVFGATSEKSAAQAKRQKKSPHQTKEDRNLELTGMGGQTEEPFRSAIP